MERTSPSAAALAGADDALLARLRAGEDSACEEFVRSNTSRMLAVARRIVGNEDQARDAVQDAFVSAFRALGEFRSGANLSTWLHRIVVNASLSQLRRRQRRAETSIDEFLPKFLADGHQATPATPWEANPVSTLQREETRKLVRDAIEQLPESYRVVMTLRDIEELDTKETAQLLGVTASVVKVRLHRARQALRTILDPYFRGGLT